jgi:hypothetical protein
MSCESFANTIIPKTDQANADDLISGPRTVKVTNVTRGNKENPVFIYTDDFEGRPYKPCLSMRRAIISAWGEYPDPWVGRSVTLYRDPEVVYGGVKVGGIRISHFSDIDEDFELMLTVTRGKRRAHRFSKLSVAMYPPADFEKNLPKMLDSIRAGKSTAEKIIDYCEKTGKLTDEQKAAIMNPQESE